MQEEADVIAVSGTKLYRSGKSRGQGESMGCSETEKGRRMRYEIDKKKPLVQLNEKSKIFLAF